MKTTKFILPVLFIALVAFSCGGSKKESRSRSNSDSMSAEQEALDNVKAEEMTRMAETASPAEKSSAPSGDNNSDDFSKMVSSSVAEVGKADSTRKLVRTADIRFRSLDVVETSYSIEDLVRKYDGFVQSSALSSEVTETTTKPISADSLVESTTYHLSNEMVIRVPVKNLDTLLKGLAPMIDFLDYRNITAEDISMNYLRKALEKKRLDLYNIQVGALTGSGTTTDRLTAIESQLQKQIQNDEALLERMEMDDKVKFATVTLHIYGRDKTRHIVLADETKIESYTPGFGRQLWQGIEKGLSALGLFIIGLVSIWPLLLAGGAVWYFVRRYKRRHKTGKEVKQPE